MPVTVTTGKGQPASCCCPSPALTERSPEEISLRAVKRRLSESPYGDVRRIDCHHHDGAIVLKGRVSSYFRRQLVLSVAMELAPGQSVRDEVRVDTGQVNPGKSKITPL